MNGISRLIFAVTIALTFGATIQAQRSFSINSTSAGGVQLGMTVYQARKALKGCRFERSSDGEGLTLISAKCKGTQIMTFFADEPPEAETIDDNARIEFIEIWDRRFKTAYGVHPNMLVMAAEKRLGRITEIVLTQTESREFITFSKLTRGISYRFYGGIYEPRTSFTKKYEKGARLHSIQVSKD